MYAIRCECLSKQYRIGKRERYKALRDVLTDGLSAPFRRLAQRAKSQAQSADASPLALSSSPSLPSPLALSSSPSNDLFWALDDVSFEVNHGEVVGIIGRNGAGKSTLLKILSRITEPTRGFAEINGRVGSLLEVGTGFHPELTGRENIYLNGAILGMKRAEIDRRFDEIVAFAETEKFLDTPVKYYSSGMQMRLAFAVAAHLDPEILLVDEVLAVGDAEFQKKCLGKMGDVANAGKTVLFVSHDLGNVTKLCQHGILLSDGRIESIGEMTAVVADYVKDEVSIEGAADLRNRGDRSGSGEARFLSIEMIGETGFSSTFSFGEPLTIKIAVEVKKNIGSPPLAIIISTSDGIPVHDLTNFNEGCRWASVPGQHLFAATIPKIHLYPGAYTIDLWLGNHNWSRVDYLKSACSFRVIQTPESGVECPLRRSNGLVFQPSRWLHETLNG